MYSIAMMTNGRLAAFCLLSMAQTAHKTVKVGYSMRRWFGVAIRDR